MGKVCDSCGMTRWENRQVTGWVDATRAENERLRAALESIRLHADGQVSQYARARESVLSIALAALAPGDQHDEALARAAKALNPAKADKRAEADRAL